MNIPAYQKKDYSYLQNAFTGLQQGLGQFQQGLATTMNIGALERKKAQEEEFLKNVKISNEEADLLRTNMIVELASDIIEAKGYSDTPESYDRAASEASQFYPPFTPEERQKGTGALSLYKRDEKREAYLNNLRKRNWERKAFGEGQPPAAQQVVPPERRTIQEPVGEVGVQEPQTGAVKKPLTTLPQTVGELQQGVLREEERGQIPQQEGLQETFAKEAPSEEGVKREDLMKLWREGARLRIADEESFKNAMEVMGRMSFMRGDITEEEYNALGLSQPVASTTATSTGLTSSQEAERIKAQRERALRPGRDYAVMDLTRLLDARRGVQETIRKYQDSIANYNDKIKKQQFAPGETRQSLELQVQGAQDKVMALNEDLNTIGSYITQAEKTAGYTPPPPYTPPPQPEIISNEAEEVADELLETMQRVAPKGYNLDSQYGRDTWSKGKGRKKEYKTLEFNLRLAQELMKLAQSRGITFKGERDVELDKLISIVDQIGLQGTINRILNASGKK